MTWRSWTRTVIWAASRCCKYEKHVGLLFNGATSIFIQYTSLARWIRPSNQLVFLFNQQNIVYIFMWVPDIQSIHRSKYVARLHSCIFGCTKFHSQYLFSYYSFLIYMGFGHIYLLHLFKANIAQIIIIGESKTVSTHPRRRSSAY
jgi:hypothetical protein